MAENLKVTKYKDGTAIPTGHSDSEWANLSTDAYAVYPTDDNDGGEAYQPTCGNDCGAVYGNLYNWYTVDDSRGVCPEGWHVPSDAEWTILTDYLGGQSDAGGKLKEEGTEHWDSPNTGATNESGFTGLPAGLRYGDSDNISSGTFGNGTYGRMGNNGYFWSSSVNSSIDAWARELGNNPPQVYRGTNNKPYGFSIRCLGD
jgi:uncharacterized protein (TIGR02145 family)